MFLNPENDTQIYENNNIEGSNSADDLGRYYSEVFCNMTGKRADSFRSIWHSGDGSNLNEVRSVLGFNDKILLADFPLDPSALTKTYLGQGMYRDFDFDNFGLDYNDWLTQKTKDTNRYKRRYGSRFGIPDDLDVEDEIQDFGKFFDKRDSLRKRLKNIKNLAVSEISDNFLYNFSDIVKSVDFENKKNKIKDTKINRMVRDSSPWDILEDGSIPEYIIGGVSDNMKLNSFDNNMLELLNYQVEGGSTIFDLLIDSYSSDLKKKE